MTIPYNVTILGIKKQIMDNMEQEITLNENNKKQDNYLFISKDNQKYSLTTSQIIQLSNLIRGNYYEKFSSILYLICIL
jgi:hypothetical protein